MVIFMASKTMNQKNLQRFTKFIQLDILSGCWIWKGALDKEGYGIFSIGKKNKRAQRLSYEHWNGKLIKNLTIDHLCRNRACVNPEHLEQVTNKENLARGQGFGALNSKKTHCPKGHPLSGENLYQRSDGRRVCWICKKETDRKIYHKDVEKYRDKAKIYRQKKLERRI